MATTSYGSPYVSGSDLVAGWPAASLTVANAIDAAGYYIGRGINAQTASVTGVLTDAGKTVTMTNAGATTFTVPLNATVAYPTGTRINILNLGAGACTVTATGGVTISGTIAALAQNGAAAIVKTGTNTWSYLPFDSGTPTLTSADVSSTTGSPTITTSGGFTIYQFTGSGTITLDKAGLCEVLLLSGGGGGGTFYSGGGGAGGHYTASDFFLASGTTTITVGAGGTGRTSPQSQSNLPGDTGGSSRIGNYFMPGGGGGSTVTVNIGGGNIRSVTGLQGGSGGGGAGAVNNGSNGSANLGAGGGGDGDGISGNKGGNGGSGIVIVKVVT